MTKLPAINIALKKPAPERIRLSSPGCLENDFFETNITIPSLNWKFLAQSKELGGYSGFLWENDKNGRNATLLSKTLERNDFTFEITHYYQGYQFVYTSPLHLMFSRATYRHKIAKIKDKLAQSIFNKKTLIRSERMELLNYIVEKTIDQPSYTTDSMSIGTHMYSNRWFHHPKRKEHQAHFKLILESLVESGELNNTDYRYSVTGKALATLSEYESDQQKHQDNINAAKTAHGLTRALIIIGGLGILTQIYIWVNSAN
jgi:hypothetical protein